MNKITDKLCDCCSRPFDVEEDHVTDDEVCQGGDGPGFFLCGTEACNARYENLDVEARRKLFTAGRERNETKKLDAEIEAMAVPVTVIISAGKLQNALVSAFEAPRYYSEHWLGRVEIVEQPSKRCVYNSDVPFFGGALRVVLPPGNGYKGTRRLITLASLQDAVRILAEKYPHHAMDLLGDTGDLITGLVLVQCASFGDIVFE